LGIDVKNTTIHYLIPGEAFTSRLLQRLEDCREAILASAFFTFPAFQVLKPGLLNALDQGARVSFLIGRFDFVTEPRAVVGLLSLATKYPGQMEVAFDADYGFHFKLATFQIKGKKTVIIGSPNLTAKGLEAVAEANLEIIRNQSIHKQATELLLGRLKKSVPAEEEIGEYRRLYNRAKKYRQQRQRWSKQGQRRWKTRRNSQAYREITGDRFLFCRISAYEDDKELTKSIRSEHQKASTAGEAFPNQWIHVDSQDYRLVNEHDYLVVCDDLSRTFGFATCMKKFKIRNRHEKLEPVIFYRYRRGWRAHFKSKSRYDRAVKMRGFRNHLTIGKSLSTNLKSYLRSRR
jgi:HKD family nuclease